MTSVINIDVEQKVNKTEKCTLTQVFIYCKFQSVTEDKIKINTN